MPYTAPVSEFKFLLEHVVDIAQITATERFCEATPDVVDAILREIGHLCDGIIAPLQREGDLHPAALENGVVRTSPGFAAGYRAIAEGGWLGLSASPEHGGMGLPLTLNTALNEMLSGACLALQLCPLLSQGQIEALEHHASDEIKAVYLPKLVSGEWTGTMNLTEPQAGSDVGAVQTRARDNGDGSFAITGQKIYITWGDHDVAENVVHLVLARLPDAPTGTRGLSLFIVPKWLPDADGVPDAPNGVTVVSLEHKLGLHGSPTCVMQYDGATGWLVGAPQGGMAAMFTMMNNARLGVGTQGIGVAEAAFQHALAYARDRRQGRTPSGERSILGHADVRRMLGGMQADIFAARAIALSCAAAIDMQQATGSAEWAARAAFLTPIAKAFGTDTGIAVANEGVQVHGGMGVIEETGAAQFCRDVRVTAIYEGTNGIQGMDLVGRKLSDGGEAAFSLIKEVEDTARAARDAFSAEAEALWDAAQSLREGTEWLLAQDDLNDRFAGSVPFLRAFARVLGAQFHLRAAQAAPRGNRAALMRLYFAQQLPELGGLLAQAQSGAGPLYALDFHAQGD
ncbi:acyl-CoA dehydrogenase [Meridianimarinicoccus roseus]|uniref:3-methylmercaptopropionyl-CoA dehydrogenase n=1 Tax=Meridianimarinicoccus roseus TaxID=2072018 RepID=A0A2V2L8Y4_9RHOB|nr:acyl-CoA dehydrogenase [Meridianimarinicoccus roseus]PWR01732.1 acyl-CoA dehydrogenase [Meridianimarinicoccus roseus]